MATYGVYAEFPDVYKASVTSTSGLAVGDLLVSDQGGSAAAHWVVRILFIHATSPVIYFEQLTSAAPQSGDDCTNGTTSLQISSAPTLQQDSTAPSYPSIGDAYAGASSSSTGVLDEAVAAADIRYPESGLNLQADAMEPHSIPAWGTYNAVVEVPSPQGSQFSIGDQVWLTGLRRFSQVRAASDTWLVLAGLASPVPPGTVLMSTAASATCARTWSPNEYLIPDTRNDQFVWLDTPVSYMYGLRVYLEPGSADTDPTDTQVLDVTDLSLPTPWAGNVVSYDNTVGNKWVLVTVSADYPRSQPFPGGSLITSPTGAAQTVRAVSWALQWVPLTSYENQLREVVRLNEVDPGPRVAGRPTTPL